MRLGRFLTDAGPRFAWVEGDVLIFAEGTFDTRFHPTGERAPFGSLPVLAPVVPSKIVAVGSNYPAHAAEMGNAVPAVPKIFLKPSTAVIGPNAPIVIPPVTTRVDPECELAVVIGKTATRVKKEDAWKHVFGYTAANDVTCRDFQKQDGVFARAKGFDSFAPLGPYVDTALDPADLLVETWVGEERRAYGRTSELFFDIPSLIAFISDVMTLLPGDVISTGTPPGVAPITAGDVVEVRISGLEPLRNPVVNRDDR